MGYGERKDKCIACTKRMLAPSRGLHQAGACTKRILAPSRAIPYVCSMIHNLTKVASASIAVFAFLSAWFFLERTLFIDTAYYLFRMSQEMTFNVELNRWAAVIPEILPWIGLKLAAPTGILLFSYSISFWLLYALIFYIMVFRLQKPEAGLTLVLSFTLFLRISWFHAVTETHQAVAWCLLLYAWLSAANPDRWLFYPLTAFFLCLLGFFSHPVSLFMQVFILAWVGWERALYKRPGLWIIFCSIVALYILKVFLTNADSYEGSFFSQLKALPEFLPRIHHAFGVKFLIAHFWDIYLWPVSIGIITACIYTIQKCWGKLFLVMSGSATFLILTWVTYFHGDADVMTEKNLMPLAIFIVLPFSEELYKPSFFLQGWRKVLATIVLIGIGMFGIIMEGFQQKQRVAWLDSLVTQAQAKQTQRGLVLKSELKEPYIGAVWALAHETLWYSAWKNGKEGVVTVYALEHLDQPPTDLSVTDLFMSTEFWLIYNAFTLNPDYFVFKEGRYEGL